MRATPLRIFRQCDLWRIIRFLRSLPDFARLFARLFSDPRVTLRAKAVPLGILAYLVLPTDFVPDVLPGVGQIDDIAVILIGLRLFLRLCPRHVVEEHVRAIGRGR